MVEQALAKKRMCRKVCPSYEINSNAGIHAEAANVENRVWQAYAIKCGLFQRNKSIQTIFETERKPRNQSQSDCSAGRKRICYDKVDFVTKARNTVEIKDSALSERTELLVIGKVNNVVTKETVFVEYRYH